MFSRPPVSFAGVAAAAYMPPTPHVGAAPEQGRYAFTALVAFAAVAGASLLAVRPRWLPLGRGCPGDGHDRREWMGQLMLLQRFYT